LLVAGCSADLPGGPSSGSGVQTIGQADSLAAAHGPEIKCTGDGRILPTKIKFVRGVPTTSCNEKNFAVFQDDGNFVVYNEGNAIFNTGTQGKEKAADSAVFEDNGRLVVYAGKKVLWESSSQDLPYPEAVLVMQNDGNLVIYYRKGAIPEAANGAIWDAKDLRASKTGTRSKKPAAAAPVAEAADPTQAGAPAQATQTPATQTPAAQTPAVTAAPTAPTPVVSNPPTSLPVASAKPAGCVNDKNFITAGWDFLGPWVFPVNTPIMSCNGAVKLVFQDDGNLVLYRTADNVSIWSSATAGKGGTSARMQIDGNLVVYNSARTPLWSSGTQSNRARLVLQDDLNLVIYTDDIIYGRAIPLWSSQFGLVP
jgi:hypothetical protein